MFTKIKKHINIFFIIIISQLSHIKNSDKEYAIEFNIICENDDHRFLFYLEYDQPFPKVYINDFESTSDIWNFTNLHTYFCDSDENLTIRLVWDTTLTNMKSMFAFNQNYITFIDFTNFDSSEVTNMEYLFSEENGIQHISFNNFSTSKVTSFRKMF